MAVGTETSVCILLLSFQRCAALSKILSNGAEQMNSVHNDVRGEPLLFLMKTINDWNMLEFTIRKNKATQWINNGQQLTDYALDKHNKSMEEATRRNVSFVQ